MMNLKNVILFEKGFKEWLLEQENNIDEGVKDLCDAINNIEDLVTMNSCQGLLINEEKEEHCPLRNVGAFCCAKNHDFIKIFL